MYVCVHKIACKGTKKNVYVQEKVYFCCHRLHFFAVASRVGCPRSTKNVYVQEKVYFCLEIVIVFLRMFLRIDDN